MAKPLQKDRDNRSGEKKQLSFQPYTLTPETAQTSVLLLESAEPEILCQTLRAITKFAAQDLSNRYVLFNLDAIGYILPHVDHPVMNVKRFALKALAQLLQLPKGPEQVLENPQNLRNIAYMLVKIEDVFVLEYASLVLSELTREPLGCEQLITANILSSLFNRMKNSLDPDVQKNCVQTLSNLLDDPVCASEVTKNQFFSWPSVLALMQSKFLAIQHTALRAVDQLICRYKDYAAQKTFRVSTGVLDLCDILESYEFRDVHALVLGVLRNYVETEENADHLFRSGCVLRLLAYLDMALPALKPPCLAVLTKMSFTANGRDALYLSGTDIVFCQQLLSSNMELLADAAMGVANMTKLLRSAARMSDTNITEALSGILADEAASWFYVRLNSLKALVELCRIIPKAAFTLVEPKSFATLRNINKKAKDTPIEAQRLVLQCYINLQSYHVSTRAMINADFMQELLNMLQRVDIHLKILTCTVLSGLMVEDIGKDLFTSRRGEEPVSNNLFIEHIGLRTALCTLIIAGVTNEGANVYLELGTVHYMVRNTQARYAVNAWETALESIFRHNPSAKFAYTGRLDINDFTQEGFYVQRRLGSTFATMSQLMAQPWPYSQPAYVIMFLKPSADTLSDSDIRVPFPQQSTTRESQSGRLQLKTLPDDSNLRSYMFTLKYWFGDPYRDKCEEVSSCLKQRAQLLGEFVAGQMCGTSQERDCSMPSVSLHIQDLMKELNSPVVGIGWVRCGGALERAVLYKALADRIGLPCAIRRVTSAHAWVEVAVPDIDTDTSDKIEDYPAGLLRSAYVEELVECPGRLCRAGIGAKHIRSAKIENYPSGLLRANYVVDLVEFPGRLCRLGSEDAQRVCGPYAPPYTAGDPPALCRCDARPDV